MAQRVDISTGVGLGEQVEVIGEIEAGDRLVVRGAERLNSGQSVQILSRANTDEQSTAAVTNHKG